MNDLKFWALIMCGGAMLRESGGAMLRDSMSAPLAEIGKLFQRNMMLHVSYAHCIEI